MGDELVCFVSVFYADGFCGDDEETWESPEQAGQGLGEGVEEEA